MPVAIIADLHANLEALEKVTEDIEEQGIKEIICLGDLVGYGPNPAEIVERAMGWPVVLMGNHDEAVVKEAYAFNPVARAAVNWTRHRLTPGFFSGRLKRERWKFLQELRLTHKTDDALFVHGSPRDPTMEYVLRSDCVDLSGGIPEKIRDIFTRFDRICFAGHTHDPGVITEESIFIGPGECNGQFTFESGKKYFVNVGSVGQPRDGDVRACYAVYDGDTVSWRRVEYDYKTTMQKIFRASRLDPRGGERLAQGR